MTGALGTTMVVLLQTAVGGVAALWLTGVQRAARRGFTVLAGVSVTVIAWSALAVARSGVGAARTAVADGTTAPSALAAAGVTGQRLLWGLAVFAALLTLWQALVLVFDDRHRLAQAVGVAGAVAGVAALGLTAVVRGADVALAFGELVAGSVFLGGALYGLLLGHWYLFQRRLEATHMQRGAQLYAAGVGGGAIALALSSFNPPPDIGAVASPLLSIPGFSVILGGGLVAVCALIAPFVWKLANEGGRSIQAATGYFYLAVVMSLSAELASKFRFFF